VADARRDATKHAHRIEISQVSVENSEWRSGFFASYVRNYNDVDSSISMENPKESRITVET
jgi:hypothetical protein